LNKNVSQNSKSSVVKLTEGIIREQNNICYDISKYDKFWKSFYFTLRYTIITINLICLQQILIDDIVLTPILMYSLGAIVYSFSHIILNLFSASVNALLFFLFFSHLYSSILFFCVLIFSLFTLLLKFFV
jgi:hypothetical protein